MISLHVNLTLKSELINLQKFKTDAGPKLLPKLGEKHSLRENIIGIHESSNTKP